jgi:hypothetical protein
MQVLMIAVNYFLDYIGAKRNRIVNQTTAVKT